MIIADEYKKIAVGIKAALNGKASLKLAVTSSNKDTDTLNAATALAVAFASLGVTSRAIKESDFNTAKSEETLLITALSPIDGSPSAMQIAALCDGVVLVETKNISRTDDIDKAIETINNAGATALGFILLA